MEGFIPSLGVLQSEVKHFLPDAISQVKNCGLVESKGDIKVLHSEVTPFFAPRFHSVPFELQKNPPNLIFTYQIEKAFLGAPISQSTP